MSEDKIIFTFVFLLIGVAIFFLYQRKLIKLYLHDEMTKSNAPQLNEIKTRINWLTISYIIRYYLGLVIAVLVHSSIGLFMASLGISLAIYYTQSLESYKTKYLVEKRLLSKFSKINVTRVEKIIAEEVSKKIVETLDLNALKNEIIEELKQK